MGQADGIASYRLRVVARPGGLSDGRNGNRSEPELPSAKAKAVARSARATWAMGPRLSPNRDQGPAFPRSRSPQPTPRVSPRRRTLVVPPTRPFRLALRGICEGLY